MIFKKIDLLKRNMCEMHNNINYREMMDYLGDIAAPEKNRAINELTNILKVKYNNDNEKISRKFINHIVEKVYNEYHVNINSYSYAGWAVFVKNELVTEASNNINSFIDKRFKIKCGLRVGCKIIHIYKDFLERSLAPGGSGYLRAKKEFMIYI